MIPGRSLFSRRESRFQGGLTLNGGTDSQRASGAHSGAEDRAEDLPRRARTWAPYWIWISLLSVDLLAADAKQEVGQRVSCVTRDCHVSLSQKRYLHGPVAKESCNSCHLAKTKIAKEAPTAGRCVAAWKLSRPEAELCQSCHPLVLRNYVHAPVAEGLCTGCHDPHGSDHAHLLASDPARKLCFSCHEQKEYTGKEHDHEPASSGACILCHDSHSSWNPRLLVKTGSRLCLTCHEDVQDEVARRRHVHDPVLKDCGGCHAPHGSEFPAQLRAAPRELCLTCHEEIQELVGTSSRVHGALETERSCLNCHAGHAADLPRFLSMPLLDGCLTCHDKTIEGAGGQKLANIALLLRNNPDHHGPVRRADCTSCHDPHASPNFRRLRGRYPKEFYLTEFDIESYGLCFQCHFRELVLVEKGPGVTRFQHGDVNLHYTHVNREKSRTCRACHATHASKNPAHIANTFTFGEWKDAPIGYEKLPDGGTCASACHRKVTYERGSEKPVPVVK